jgi:hypothetical protein
MAPLENREQEFIDFVKKVTPEGLFNYYNKLNRAERRRIDQKADRQKRANQKIRKIVEGREKEKNRKEMLKTFKENIEL